jgi:hypothetical protein
MKNETIKTVINTSAIITMATGLYGMYSCLIVLFPIAGTEDILIRGFTFVGSSILFGTGLLTLGLFNKRENKQNEDSDQLSRPLENAIEEVEKIEEK